MITPEYLLNIIKATEDKVSDVNEYLTVKIAERIKALFIKSGNVELIPSSIYDVNKQIEAGKCIDEIQEELNKHLPGIEKEVKKAFLDAADQIATGNDEFTKEIVNVEKLNIDIPSGMTEREKALLESAYRRTSGEMRNITKTTASASQDAFVNACDNAYMKMSHGVSPNDAVESAVSELAQQGITTVSYGGRNDKIDVAIARAARTGINMANADITLCRCAELGVNYVLVSSHLGARVTDRQDFTNHSMWQGQVYSLDWNNPVLSKYNFKENTVNYNAFKKIRLHFAEKKAAKTYKDFIEVCGYGQMLGISGINCRHTFNAFYPGISKNNNVQYDTEENKIQYEHEQKLRALEKDIRNIRREIAAQKAIGGDTTDLQNKLSKYIEKNKHINSRLYGANSINNYNFQFNNKASFDVNLPGVSDEVNEKLQKLRAQSQILWDNGFRT